MTVFTGTGRLQVCELKRTCQRGGGYMTCTRRETDAFRHNDELIDVFVWFCNDKYVLKNVFYYLVTTGTTKVDNSLDLCRSGS